VPAREEWEAPVEPTPVLITSSATGLGLDELRAELFRRVPVVEDAVLPPGLEPGEDLEEHRTFRPAAGRRAGKDFEVEQVEEGLWRVAGGSVDRLIARHDMENLDALAHVERRLHRMGVIRALEAHGFEPGDDVEIGGVVFELDPS
jgi:GTP-binding protein